MITENVTTISDFFDVKASNLLRSINASLSLTNSPSSTLNILSDSNLLYHHIEMLNLCPHPDARQLFSDLALFALSKLTHPEEFKGVLHSALSKFKLSPS